TSVDVAAPGVHILSTYTNPAYGHMQGTSMATPFVSGLAALLRDSKSTRDKPATNEDLVSVSPTVNVITSDAPPPSKYFPVWYVASVPL
ncbi:MAG: hypothetical protein CMQ58_03845, partial [Gammaproteobacteria bacterium]|nr:hypothetical protein [Gammaproteobacteria bacterium]